MLDGATRRAAVVADGQAMWPREDWSSTSHRSKRNPAATSAAAGWEFLKMHGA